MAAGDGDELSAANDDGTNGICSESNDRSGWWTSWVEKATRWLAYSYHCTHYIYHIITLHTHPYFTHNFAIDQAGGNAAD